MAKNTSQEQDLLTTPPTKTPSVGQQKPAPHLKFMELSAALGAIEDEAVEALEEDQEIGDTTLLKIGAYLQARKEHTDDVVRWRASTTARIAFLKDEEARVKAIRLQGETLLKEVDKYLKKFIKEDNSGERLNGEVYHIRSQNNSQSRLVVENPEKWKANIEPKFHRKTAHFTINLDENGKSILETLGSFAAAYKEDSSVKFAVSEAELDESLLRDTIKAGIEIDGVKLVRGKHIRDSAPKDKALKK